VSKGALLALIAVLAGACRSEIDLGNPDAGTIPAPTGSVVLPPRCPGVPSRAVVTVVDSAWGDLRAIAAGGGTLYALFARAGTNEGVLARVPASGGTLAEVARVGLDPSALAVGPSGFVFAAARGSAQVFRVDSLGSALVAEARGGPSSVVADDGAGAFWTVPTSDSVVTWGFAGGTPSAIATSPRATSLLRTGGTLYITAENAVHAFEPGRDAAPRKIADRCDGGTPAVDGTILYCSDGGSIARVELTTGTTTTVATAQPGARNLVLGAGRVFWRAAPSPAQTLVMARPLDGIGGPTVIESSGPGPLALALEGCDLYFSAGPLLIRRGL
jgi:hypothetical protein